jgi:hypothetical protein
VLGEREDGLLLNFGVFGKAQDRIQCTDRAVGAHLGQPEYGLAPNLGVRIAADRFQQDVFGSGLILLGNEEDRLSPETGGSRVPSGQHPAEDGTSTGFVHLLQSVEGGNLHVGVGVGAVALR